MSAQDRLPVLVGAGQLRANRDRTVEGAREPMALLVAVLEAAEADCGVAGLLRRADSVHAVRVASWAYDDLARRVGVAVGAAPAHCEDTGLGGHWPVRLLDRAAARIWSGESEIALLVGAEAQASLGVLRKAGLDPVADGGWSATPGGPPAFDVDTLGSTLMQAAELLAPTRVYPLFENRLQADLGLTPAQAAAESARLYAAQSVVAAGHPAAWQPRALSPEEVGTVGPGNRMVCEPYPLSMNAMPHVDQAAAVVLTSRRAALELGVPEAQLVHVWGGAGADDTSDVLARQGFGRSLALECALSRCLEAGGVAAADLDLVDVYSCFPIVPKLVAGQLGLPRDSALTVTGGHSSFGGPLNSYSLHAIATVAQRLRTEPGLALVHANGGYLTSQHAVLLSGSPHPDGYVGHPEPVTVDAPEVRTATVAEAADGAASLDVTVETASVEHDKGGGPRQAFLVARTADGTRTAVATPVGDAVSAARLSLDALPAGRTTHVGRPIRLVLSDDGTATLEETA